MNKTVSRILSYSLLGVVVAALVVMLLRPSPLPVDTARVSRGPLRVTIDEDGEARSHDRYVVAAPVSGKLERIELHDGDHVTRNQLLAVIDPPPLDARQLQEYKAKVDAAALRQMQAREEVERARAKMDLARKDQARAEQLAREGTISAQQADTQRTAATAAARELAAAQFQAQAAGEDVKAAQASLLAANDSASRGGAPITVRSPVDGAVLRVIEKSQRVVAQGTPLLSIGEPSHLEVVVDLLSSDALKVRPDATMLLSTGSGNPSLRAKVRTVEPYAFTKISALGVEEQRVNVVGDFVDSPGTLGDGYRVDAQIILWESYSVLKLPVGALFRQGEQWAVFRIVGDKAQLHQVGIGHMNSDEAEVLNGLAEGDQVITHPPNELTDGALIKRR
jgi:HlyD family secretion protein